MIPSAGNLSAINDSAATRRLFQPVAISSFQRRLRLTISAMPSNSPVFSRRSLASVTPNEVSNDAHELPCTPDASIPTDNELETYAHSIGLTNEGKSDAKCVIVCLFLRNVAFLDVRRLASVSPDTSHRTYYVCSFSDLQTFAKLQTWTDGEERRKNFRDVQNPKDDQKNACRSRLRQVTSRLVTASPSYVILCLDS